MWFWAVRDFLCLPVPSGHNSLLKNIHALNIGNVLNYEHITSWAQADMLVTTTILKTL